MDEATPAEQPDRRSGFNQRALSPDAMTALRDARLRQLVDGHFDFIWRSLRRLGVPHADVDDSAQEVFMVASRRLDDIEPGRERAFLFGTAARVASTFRRTVSRRREHGGMDLDDTVDPSPDPEQAIARLRSRETLQQLLLDMDLEYRTVFVLFELEQLAVPEIAELLEIPVGTVASRLRRARELFVMSAKRFQARQTFLEQNHD